MTLLYTHMLSIDRRHLLISHISVSFFPGTSPVSICGRFFKRGFVPLCLEEHCQGGLCHVTHGKKWTDAKLPSMSRLGNKGACFAFSL